MTCKEIYDLAMSLMDEKKDLSNIDGVPESDYVQTKDYMARTPGILTSLQNEVVTFLKGRGIDIDYLDTLTTMNDNVDLEDYICQSVLNYGLAARLLGQEDRNLSSYFSDLYLGNLQGAAVSSDDRVKGKQYSGENVYGLMRAGD
jgi:hypothetical protein